MKKEQLQHRLRIKERTIEVLVQVITNQELEISKHFENGATVLQRNREARKNNATIEQLNARIKNLESGKLVTPTVVEYRKRNEQLHEQLRAAGQREGIQKSLIAGLEASLKLSRQETQIARNLRSVQDEQGQSLSGNHIEVVTHKALRNLPIGSVIKTPDGTFYAKRTINRFRPWVIVTDLKNKSHLSEDIDLPATVIFLPPSIARR